MTTTKSRTSVVKDHLAQPGAALRPVVTYINGDVSYVMSFPCPASDEGASNKIYYHAVIDPWFGGTAVLSNRYILSMRMGRPSGIVNIGALNEAIYEIETAAGNPSARDERAIDGLFILSSNTDHFVRDLLVQFDPAIPIFAAPEIIKGVQSLKHFRTTVQLPEYDPAKMGSWQDARAGPSLPSWLAAFMLQRTHINNFALALVTSAHEGEHEMVLHAPHGFYDTEKSVRALGESSNPPVSMLALVAPYKDSYFLGMETIANVSHALKILQRGQGKKYLIRTGDFVSHVYGGVLGLFIKENDRSLEWGVAQLRKEVGEKQELAKIRVSEIENGASMVLV